MMTAQKLSRGIDIVLDPDFGSTIVYDVLSYAVDLYPGPVLATGVHDLAHSRQRMVRVGRARLLAINLRLVRRNWNQAMDLVVEQDSFRTWRTRWCLAMQASYGLLLGVPRHCSISCCTTPG